ncbi:MAG: hypothetical protein M3Z29_04585, partial [Pseudomonadota bacterium]|nr:hypothetical protein [Pseudomonadota bacterium]
ELPTFQRRLVAFSNELDFGLVSATVVVDRPGTAALFCNTGNTQEGFLEASANVSDSRRDPVMKRLKRTSVPFRYDQALYVDSGVGGTSTFWLSHRHLGCVTSPGSQALPAWHRPREAFAY